MTRTRYSVTGFENHYLAFNPTDSGPVRLYPGGEWHAIAPLNVASDGLVIGGLVIGAPSESRVDVGNFEYKTEASLFDTSFDIPFLSLGPIGMAARDEKVSKRDAIKLAGIMTGFGIFGQDNTDDELLTVCEMEIKSNPRGVNYRLSGHVSGVLPTDKEFIVQREGVEQDRFKANELSAVLPRGRIGTVSILTEPDRSFWHDVRKTLHESDPVVIDTTLPQQADDYDEGETVRVISSSELVDQVAEAGHSETVVVIGEDSIPHREESSGMFHKPGSWFVDGDAVVFEAGPDPPSSVTVHIEIGVGRVRETIDDASRRP